MTAVSGIRAFSSELRAGLFGPSRLAAAVTALVTVSLLALVPFVLTPAAVRAGPERLLMMGSWDEYGLLTARAMQMADRPRRADEVILLGTSVLLEGVSRPSDLADGLQAALGREIPVYSLSASGQSPIDYVATLDAVAPTRGLVVLTPTFAYPYAEYAQRIASPRYGFRSPWMDETLRGLGATPIAPSGSYAFDNRHFFVNRLPYIARNAALGPPAYSAHAHIGHPPFEGKDPTWFLSRMHLKFAAVDENFDTNARIFEDVVTRVRAAGGEVVFVESPVNPAYREAYFTPEVVDCQRRVAAFAERLGVRRLDVQADAALSPDDFNDVVHLHRMPAMERYTAALARALAPLLAERR